MRTNGEKAKQRYSWNFTRSLNKSQEETTKQHKKVCQPVDLQAEEDFLTEILIEIYLRIPIFHLAPLLLTKLYLETISVLTSKLKVYSKKIVIKLIWL